MPIDQNDESGSDFYNKVMNESEDTPTSETYDVASTPKEDRPLTYDAAKEAAGGNDIPMPPMSSQRRQHITLTMAADVDPDTAQDLIEFGDIRTAYDIIDEKKNAALDAAAENIAGDPNVDLDVRAKAMETVETTKGDRADLGQVPVKIAQAYGQNMTSLHHAMDKSSHADFDAVEASTAGWNAPKPSLLTNVRREAEEHFGAVHEQVVTISTVVDMAAEEELSKAQEHENAWGNSYGLAGGIADYGYWAGAMLVGGVLQPLADLGNSFLTGTRKGTHLHNLVQDIRYNSASPEEAVEKLKAYGDSIYSDAERINFYSTVSTFDSNSAFNINALQFADTATAFSLATYAKVSKRIAFEGAFARAHGISNYTKRVNEGIKTQVKSSSDLVKRGFKNKKNAKGEVKPVAEMSDVEVVKADRAATDEDFMAALTGIAKADTAPTKKKTMEDLVKDQGDIRRNGKKSDVGEPLDVALKDRQVALKKERRRIEDELADKEAANTEVFSDNPGVTVTRYVHVDRGYQPLRYDSAWDSPIIQSDPVGMKPRKDTIGGLEGGTAPKDLPVQSRQATADAAHAADVTHLDSRVDATFKALSDAMEREPMPETIAGDTLESEALAKFKVIRDEHAKSRPDTSDYIGGLVQRQLSAHKSVLRSTRRKINALEAKLTKALHTVNPDNRFSDDPRTRSISVDIRSIRREIQHAKDAVRSTQRAIKDIRETGSKGARVAAPADQLSGVKGRKDKTIQDLVDNHAEATARLEDAKRRGPEIVEDPTITDAVFESRPNLVNRDKTNPHLIHYDTDGNASITLHGGDTSATKSWEETSRIRTKVFHLQKAMSEYRTAMMRVASRPKSLRHTVEHADEVEALEGTKQAILKIAHELGAISTKQFDAGVMPRNKVVKAIQDGMGRTKDAEFGKGAKKPGRDTQLADEPQETHLTRFESSVVTPLEERFKPDHAAVKRIEDSVKYEGADLDKRGALDDVITPSARDDESMRIGMNQSEQVVANPFVEDVNVVATDLAKKVTGDPANAHMYHGLAKRIVNWMKKNPDYGRHVGTGGELANSADGHMPSDLPWFMRQLPVYTKGAGTPLTAHIPLHEAKNLEDAIAAEAAIKNATVKHSKQVKETASTIPHDEVVADLAERHGMTAGDVPEDLNSSDAGHLLMSLYSRLGRLMPRAAGNKKGLPLGRLPRVWVPSASIVKKVKSLAKGSPDDRRKAYGILIENIKGAFNDHLIDPAEERDVFVRPFKLPVIQTMDDSIGKLEFDISVGKDVEANKAKLAKFKARRKERIQEGLVESKKGVDKTAGAYKTMLEKLGVPKEIGKTLFGDGAAMITKDKLDEFRRSVTNHLNTKDMPIEDRIKASKAIQDFNKWLEKRAEVYRAFKIEELSDLVKTAEKGSPGHAKLMGKLSQLKQHAGLDWRDTTFGEQKKMAVFKNSIKDSNALALFRELESEIMSGLDDFIGPDGELSGELKSAIDNFNDYVKNSPNGRAISEEGWKGEGKIDYTDSTDYLDSLKSDAPSTGLDAAMSSEEMEAFGVDLMSQAERDELSDQLVAQGHDVALGRGKVRGGDKAEEDLINRFRNFSFEADNLRKRTDKIAKDAYRKRTVKDKRLDGTTRESDANQQAAELANMLLEDDGANLVGWGEVLGMNSETVNQFLGWQREHPLGLVTRTRALLEHYRVQQEGAKIMSKWKKRERVSNSPEPNVVEMLRDQKAQVQDLINFYDKIADTPSLKKAWAAGTVYENDIKGFSPAQLKALSETEQTILDPMNTSMHVRRDTAASTVRKVEVAHKNISTAKKKADVEANPDMDQPPMESRTAAETIDDDIKKVEAELGMSEPDTDAEYVSRVRDQVAKSLEKSDGAHEMLALNNPKIFGAIAEAIRDIFEKVTYDRPDRLVNHLDGDGMAAAVKWEMDLRDMHAGHFSIDDVVWGADSNSLRTFLTPNGGGWADAKDARAFISMHGMENMAEVERISEDLFGVVAEFPLSPDNQTVQEALADFANASKDVVKSGAVGGTKGFGRERLIWGLGNALRINGEHLHTLGLKMDSVDAGLNQAITELGKALEGIFENNPNLVTFINHGILREKDWVGEVEFKEAWKGKFGKYPTDLDYKQYTRYLDADKVHNVLLTAEQESAAAVHGIRGYRLSGATHSDVTVNGRMIKAIPDDLTVNDLSKTMVMDANSHKLTRGTDWKAKGALEGSEGEPKAFLEVSAKDFNALIKSLRSREPLWEAEALEHLDDGDDITHVYVAIHSQADVKQAAKRRGHGIRKGGRMQAASFDPKDGSPLRFLRSAVTDADGHVLHEITHAQVHASKADDVVARLKTAMGEVKRMASKEDLMKALDKANKGSELHSMKGLFMSTGKDRQAIADHIWEFVHGQKDSETLHIGHIPEKGSLQNVLGLKIKPEGAASIDMLLSGSNNARSRTGSMKFIGADGTIGMNPAMAHPMTALQQALSSSAAKLANTQYVHEATQLFVEQYGGMYELGGEHISLWQTNPVRALSLAKLKDNLPIQSDAFEMKRAAEQARKSMLSLMHASESYDEVAESYIDNIAGWGSYARKAVSTQAGQRIVKALGTPAGHKYINWLYRFGWNPTQVFKQRNGIAGVLALSDQPMQTVLADIGQSFKFEYAHRLRKEGWLVGKVDAVLGLNEKISAKEMAEFKAMDTVFDRLGMGNIGKSNSDLNDFAAQRAGRLGSVDPNKAATEAEPRPYSKARGAAKSFVDSAGSFYEFGESHSYQGFTHSWNTQKRAALKAKGTFDPKVDISDDRLLKDVSKYQQHMYSSTRGVHQRDWMSALNIFSTWHHGLTKQFNTAETTMKQKGRIAGVYTALYGLPAGLALSYLPDRIIGGEGDSTGPVEEFFGGDNLFAKTLSRGIVGMATGDANPTQGRDMLFDKGVSLLLNTDKTEAVIGVFGVSGGTVHQSYKALSDVGSWVRGGFSSDNYNAVEILSGLGSWASVATRAFVLAHYNEYYTTSGRPMGPNNEYGVLQGIKMAITGNAPEGIQLMGRAYGERNTLTKVKQAILGDGMTAMRKAWRARARGDMSGYEMYQAQYEEIAKGRPGLFDKATRARHLQQVIAEFKKDAVKGMLLKTQKLHDEVKG